MEVVERVLLDSALFDHIVSFQSGLPGRIYSYWQRHRIFYDDLPTKGELVAIAVAAGDVAMLAQLHALSLSSTYYQSMALLEFRDAIPFAAQQDQVTVLEWLHTDSQDDVNHQTNAAEIAALSGNSDALRWLLTHCTRCSHGVCIDTAKASAERGATDVVRCLFDLRPELFRTPDVMMRAVECGHVDIVAYLHEKLLLLVEPGATMPQRRYCKGSLDLAAAAGRLDVLKYLHVSCSERCTTDAMDRAAANGHLAVVQFLHGHRTEGCTVYALDQAAANGHLDVVTFLHENRREGATIYAMSAASRRGYLDVVTYLHENRREGCSSWALAEAAEKGHLDVVQFLHANHQGTDWEDSALFRAARNGHLNVVTFLCENTTIGDRVFDARRGAKSLEHVDVVTYLDTQIKKLLDFKESEMREKLRRRKHAKAKKKKRK